MRKHQHGVTLIEVSIVIVAALIMLAIGINYTTNLSRVSQRKQATDQQAREMAQMARATKEYIKANPTKFALNTNVSVSVADLTAGGYLPAGFANRAGTGAALSPFGQPYVIVGRKLAADDPATAVITESGSALPEKLPSIGVENAVEALLGLKRDIAAQTNQNYQVIAGTIPAGSRTAEGAGGAFTKDLSAYFTAGFTQAAPVALVNFKDLEPGGGGGGGNNGGNPLPKAKEYTSCNYVTATVPAGQTSVPHPEGKCDYKPPSGRGWANEWVTPMVTNCDGAAITVLPFGGALTNGWWEAEWPAYDDCPPSQPNCVNVERRGSVTMNQVSLVSGFCSYTFWSSGVQKVINYQWQAVGVCCSYWWDGT